MEDMPTLKGIKLAVIGLGHIGLPTALGLADLGWEVVGTDHDINHAMRIDSGESPFQEPDLEALLKTHLQSRRFRIEFDIVDAINEATVIFICVGTPQCGDGAADLSQMDNVMQSIAMSSFDYKLIVQKSTAPVFSAHRMKENLLRHIGNDMDEVLKSDRRRKFDIAVNPEFLREGHAVHDFFNPARIVLGVDSDRARDLLTRIYTPLIDRRKFDSTVLITDLNSAEIIKHASNAFLSTKISFANMIADLCEVVGANVEDVTRGLGMDPRVGPEYLNPGIGFGGYCLPKDLRAFKRVGEDNGVDFSLLTEIERINDARVNQFLDQVGFRLGSLAGKKIAIWGLSFKAGTDDVRDATSSTVVQSLLDAGALLRLYDPKAILNFTRLFPAEPPVLVYCQSPIEAADQSDAVLILTEWKQFKEIDWEDLRSKMAGRLIADGRNLLEPRKMRSNGFDYYSIGRP